MTNKSVPVFCKFVVVPDMEIIVPVYNFAIFKLNNCYMINSSVLFKV